MMPGDVDPGFYLRDGAMLAAVEQVRALMRDAIREAKTAFVCVQQPDGDTFHMTLGDDASPEGMGAFLLFVAARCLTDAANALSVEREDALGLLIAAMDLGIGE